MKSDYSKNRIPVLIWVLTALLLIAAVAVTNYICDPGGIFVSPSAGALKAVEILSSGKNAANMDNYNERMVKRFMVERSKGVSVLALGSSRVALVTSEMAGTNSFLNLSVAGAMMEEAIAYYGLYYRDHGAPERVIFSVDPWFFCEDFDSLRFQNSVGDGFCYYVGEVLGYDLDPADYRVDAYYLDPQSFSFRDLSLKIKAQIFSVTYFQSSVKSLFLPKIEIEPTEEMYGVNGILRSDGSFAYPEDYRNGDVAVINARAVGSGLIGEGTYDLDSGSKRRLFEDFIHSMLADGVDVDILLVPLNPVTYDKSLDENIPLAEIEEYILGFCTENGIEVSGSYLAENENATMGDFYDGLHFVPMRIAKLVERFGGGE